MKELVYISNDMSKNNRETQNQNRKRGIEERDKDNRIRTGYMKLEINVVTWK